MFIGNVLDPTTLVKTCIWKHEKSSTHRRDLDSFVTAVHSIIPSPSEFATNYTNPCWYMDISVPQIVRQMLYAKAGNLTDSEASYIMSEIVMKRDKFGRVRLRLPLLCIPQVYFIGFPRSGSTQLYNMMTRHPQLIGGKNKEPHWWTRFPFVDKFPHDLLAIIRYLIHYQDASKYIKSHPKALTIDGSQSTIWDTRYTHDMYIMPSLLSNIVPGAKYIVIMRDPVSRLYSDYAYLCDAYWERNNFKNVPEDYLKSAPNMFHSASEAEIKGFKNCLNFASLDVCTHCATKGPQVLGPICGKARLGINLYYVHVARWLKVIPREKFLFLRMEDLARDPYSLMQEVWQFLDLPMQSAEEMGDVLYEHHNTNQLSHMKSLQMRNQTKKMLRDFFQPYNEELAKLLQDDRFLWTDV